MKKICMTICMALLVWGCGSDDSNNSGNPPSTPSAPENLVTSNVAARTVTLTWADRSDNEEGFTLERSEDSDFNFTTQIDINANQTSHSDTGLVPETPYYYRIQAYNQTGSSAYCSPITVTTSTVNDSAGELVYSYGFEDWAGNAADTPGYFSSNNDPSYWDVHTAATEVVASGIPECGQREAYEGDFYFHQNFYTGALDPCLGTTPIGINPHTNIGANLEYPDNPKSNFDISTAITSNTVTVRFYFRTTGNWPNAVTNDMKFIRVIGQGGQTCLLEISDDGTTFDLYDHPHPDDSDVTWGDYHNRFTAPIDWNDGLWHSVVMVVERLNDTNTAPNLQVSAWWDDWEMTGPADGTAEVWVDGFGTTIPHIALFVNWGATYPDSDMGLDMDNIEIWNGRP